MSINCPSIFDGRARSWGAQPAQSVSSVASRRGSAPACFFGSGVRRPHPPAVLRQRPVSVARLGGGRSQVQILSPRLRARLAQDGPGGRRPGHKGVRTLGIRALAARRAEARGKRRIGARSHELSHAGRRDSTLPSSPTVVEVARLSRAARRRTFADRRRGLRLAGRAHPWRVREPIAPAAPSCGGGLASWWGYVAGTSEATSCWCGSAHVVDVLRREGHRLRVARAVRRGSPALGPQPVVRSGLRRLRRVGTSATPSEGMAGFSSVRFFPDRRG